MKRTHPRRAASAWRALVVPVAGFGGLMLALGVATGSARRIIEAIPLPEPGPNGWPLFVLLVIGGGCWLRMARAVTTPHEPDELAARRRQTRPRTPEPLAGCEWPDVDPGGPFFGTAPFTQAAQPRRLHPLIPTEDRHADPEQFAPTLLPVDPEADRSVRS